MNVGTVQLLETVLIALGLVIALLYAVIPARAVAQEHAKTHVELVRLREIAWKAVRVHVGDAQEPEIAPEHVMEHVQAVVWVCVVLLVRPTALVEHICTALMTSPDSQVL
jgi:hypothetical protein